jgi:hypothetical protein
MFKGVCRYTPAVSILYFGQFSSFYCSPLLLHSHPPFFNSFQYISLYRMHFSVELWYLLWFDSFFLCVKYIKMGVLKSLDFKNLKFKSLDSVKPNLYMCIYVHYKIYMCTYTLMLSLSLTVVIYIHDVCLFVTFD